MLLQFLHLLRAEVWSKINQLLLYEDRTYTTIFLRRLLNGEKSSESVKFLGAHINEKLACHILEVPVCGFFAAKKKNAIKSDNVRYFNVTVLFQLTNKLFNNHIS